MAEVRQVATDISFGFDKFVSLSNYIGNKQSVNKLQMVIDQFHWDITEGRNPKINPIMLIGSNATTLAHAYSNSFGNIDFFECEACNFGMGQAPYEFFQQGNDFSSYFIKGVEKLSVYNNYGLIKLLRDNILIVPPIVNIKKRQHLKFNRLIILSAYNADLINTEIFNNIDVYCYLQPLSKKEIYRALEQRIQYLSWAIESRSILKTITDVSNGIDVAMQILEWSYRSCRSDGRGILTTADLNNALHLLK